MQNISESLKKQREQILADSSEELLSRHTSLLEIAVISLYNRLVNRLNLDAEQFRSNGAVLAFGAFGRGLIGPTQPVPLLFLTGESFAWKQSWIDEITGPLMEAGWGIDARQGTIEQLLEKAQGDFPFFLRLMETRYISGSRMLMDQLDKALESLIEDRRDDLLGRLYETVKVREARLGDPESWLEPDLDQSPGALFDIMAIRIACRIGSNIRSLEDAIFRGYLVRREVDFLQRAEKTYARLLCLLQNIQGNATAVLRFEDQEVLAGKLGYSATAGFLPVEAFMQEVFQLFHGVMCYSQEFWERLQESRAEGDGAVKAPAEPLEEGLFVRFGKISLQTDRYPATAGHLVHLFTIAAKKGLGFANVTRQWIQHHHHALDTAAGDPQVKEEFLELIRSDAPHLPVLRRFYDRGLLTALIPELAAVHALVQHDAFHLYPVHEHHLRTLSEVKRLLAGEHSQAEPELTKITQAIDDPVPVLLAGLLHDIGKSSGKGHAIHGSEMIPTIARRLGLSQEESDTLQFLVNQHLLLMDNASLRDLADEEMLARCARVIGSWERLDLLLLLTFADMAAMGPKAQQKWRDTPVILLYERICHALERGEPSPQAIAERIDHVRTQVGRRLADLMDDAQLDACFEQLAPRYLLSMPPTAIARHLRLQWRLEQSEEFFIWEVSLSAGAAELTLVSREQSGLLARAAGILTLHDMNIVEAQVFTMNNGVTLLIFQCRLPGTPEDAPDWDAIRDDMAKLLHGKMALAYRIANRASRREVLQAPVRFTPSQILIDNESSAKYTIIEVYTVDRLGLLYTISRALLELQIRIYVAKITTKIDQVADVFYVRTHEDRKVLDSEQISEIKNALHFWLDGPEGGTSN